MNAELLRNFKNKHPFTPFTIRMTDGTDFHVNDPEDLILHPDWNTDAIVVRPGGKWSFIYLKNVAHVSSEGDWPKNRRRRGKDRNHDD
jgi:hypothetical protein